MNARPHAIARIDSRRNRRSSDTLAGVFTTGVWLCLCALLMLLCAGCGPGGPELVPVEGTITLDDEPLANASVEFQPEHGSPSIATTDRQGHYVLKYGPDRPGAMVGTHTVRISTYGRSVDGGVDHYTPERVPPRYNEQTELIRQVKSGQPVMNFDLKSD